MKQQELGTKKVTEFFPTPPFNFDATMHKPSHFPSNDTQWQPGVRWQTMRWKGNYLGLKFEKVGTIGKPIVRLAIFSKEKLTRGYLDQLMNEINFRYDFQADLNEFNRLFEKETLLGEIINRWKGMRVATYVSLYEYLIVGIVLQNATVRRSVAMLQNLYEKYGVELAFDYKVLSAFWSPERLADVSETELRQLKVGYRAKALIKVSQAFVDGKMDELDLRTKDKETQRQTLLSLYGVGPATVGYILFDVFKHYGELRHISPWEQKIYSKLFFNKDPEDPVPVEKLLTFFDHTFGIYKMLVVHYIWEDLFWQRKNEQIPWLEKLIRL